jgi:hypothetical protein
MNRIGTPPMTEFVGPVAVMAHVPEPVFVQDPATVPVMVQVAPTTVVQPTPGVPDTTGVAGTPVVGVAVRVGVAVMTVAVGVAVGATILTVTVEQVRVPAASTAIQAWLVAVLGVVAVVLTRKFMTACPPEQLAEAMKPAGGTRGGTVGNVHWSPFWNARPVCQESTKPCF